MHYGDVSLHKTRRDLPETARPADFVENGQIIIVYGKVIRRCFKARMFRTFDGGLYLKVEEYKDPEADVLTLYPGAYFDIPGGAHPAGCYSLTLKPGLHGISSIIRMCCAKRVQGQNEHVWTMRKKVLQAIAGSYNWFETGTYEIIAGKQSPLPKTETASLSFRIRRPDFAIGTITDSEQQKLQRHLNNWNRRARRTEPLAKAQLIEAINQLYAAFGLNAPRVVIVPSPVVVAVAGSFATALCYANKNCGAKADSGRQAFEAVATGEIYEATIETAFHAIEDSIDSETLKVFEKRLDEAAGTSTARSFNGAAGAAIENALSDASDLTAVSITRDQSGAFEESIAAAVFQATRLACGMDVGTLADAQSLLKPWASKYSGVNFKPERLAQALCDGRQTVRGLMLSCLRDCASMLKIGNRQRYDELLTSALKDVLDLNLMTGAHNLAWQNVATKCGAILLHEEFCIVSDFPDVLNVDEQGRPHCDNGPSYIWKDGWTLYHWHGTRVTKQIIEKMETVTVEDIKREPNLEVRRLMLERFGSKRFLIESDAQEIHRDECGVLYSQVVHPAFEPIVMVKVVNSTAEPDGTFKDYFLQVPPFLRTAKAAVAWTFGVSSDEYSPQVQT